MQDDIPPVDPDLGDSGRESRQEDLEFELLQLEAAVQRLSAKELGQRYWIKWIAVLLALCTSLGMFGLLWHLTHSVFWGPFVFAGSGFTIAMVVAPIFSITTITVALFVGAFGRFKEKDLENAGKVSLPGLDKLGS